VTPHCKYKNICSDMLGGTFIGRKQKGITEYIHDLS
jgi:hypothetical protein